MEEWKESEVPMADQIQVPELASGSLSPLYLCAALVGHTDDVRSLAIGKSYLYSGSRDCIVKAWALDGAGHICGVHSCPTTEIRLRDWVNAMTVRPSHHLSQPASSMRIFGSNDDLIVAGCKDGGIYTLQWEEQRSPPTLDVKQTLLGHSAPICSLSWTSSGLLLSGSWDDTARGWDVDSGSCTWVLGGHENNVSVLGLASSLIATGSTGIVVEGKLLGYQIRLWQGTPPKEVRSLTQHAGSIRDLCSVADAGNEGVAFCSSSNDGTVRVWGPGGDCLGTYSVPDDSFIFCVRHLGGGVVAAGDDAGNLSLMDISNASSGQRGEAIVAADHPKTVWCLEALNGTGPATGTMTNSEGGRDIGGGCTVVTSDVATGSADKNVRVFTADEGRALKGQELADALEALGEGGSKEQKDIGQLVSGQGGGLVLESEMGVYVGEEDGQISVFLDAENHPQVYRWRGGQADSVVEEAKGEERMKQERGQGGTRGRWEALGPLKEPVRKEQLDGVLYDQVIPVEVHSASKGFLNLSLGLNQGDDPQVVAEDFCGLHDLGHEYRTQIAEFVSMMATLKEPNI